MRRVLVVDDETIVVTFLRSLLAAEKVTYEIRTASTGDDAVEAAVGWSPHLLILDINIPGKDGIEVCRIVKQNARCRQTVVLGMTGDSDHARIDAMLEAGAVECVAKPFALKDFVQKVRHYADQGLQAEAMYVDTK